MVGGCGGRDVDDGVVVCGDCGVWSEALGLALMGRKGVMRGPGTEPYPYDTVLRSRDQEQFRGTKAK